MYDNMMVYAGVIALLLIIVMSLDIATLVKVYSKSTTPTTSVGLTSGATNVTTTKPIGGTTTNTSTTTSSTTPISSTTTTTTPGVNIPGDSGSTDTKIRFSVKDMIEYMKSKSDGVTEPTLFKTYKTLDSDVNIGIDKFNDYNKNNRQLLELIHWCIEELIPYHLKTGSSKPSSIRIINDVYKRLFNSADDLLTKLSTSSDTEREFTQLFRLCTIMAFVLDDYPMKRNLNSIIDRFDGELSASKKDMVDYYMVSGMNSGKVYLALTLGLLNRVLDNLNYNLQLKYLNSFVNDDFYLDGGLNKRLDYQTVLWEIFNNEWSALDKLAQINPEQGTKVQNLYQTYNMQYTSFGILDANDFTKLTSKLTKPGMYDTGISIIPSAGILRCFSPVQKKYMVMRGMSGGAKITGKYYTKPIQSVTGNELSRYFQFREVCDESWSYKPNTVGSGIITVILANSVEVEIPLITCDNDSVSAVIYNQKENYALLLNNYKCSTLLNNLEVSEITLVYYDSATGQISFNSLYKINTQNMSGVSSAKIQLGSRVVDLQLETDHSIAYNGTTVEMNIKYFQKSIRDDNFNIEIQLPEKLGNKMIGISKDKMKQGFVLTEPGLAGPVILYSQFSGKPLYDTFKIITFGNKDYKLKFDQLYNQYTVTAD